MSAAHQSRVPGSESILKADSETRIDAPSTERQDPLQLLREVIDSLNASNGKLPDEAQVSGLLAEAREAFERANVVARTLAKCQEFLKEAQFEQALQALNASLQTYPGETALVARRAEVDEQQRAFVAGAAARKVIEESQWLLDQDRPDLAACLLKGKAAELPGQPDLNSRLDAVEAMLPEWENKRSVRTALEQAAALEQLQQWQAALTTLEEALQSIPSSEVLAIAVARVRERLTDHDREKKLALRLKLISQKIATQQWQPALALLDEARREFPRAPDLELLHRELDAGVRRSACEAVITEVRQCIEGGELEMGQQALQRGMESLGRDPSLETLKEELAGEARYREQLRNAQTLFGHRQLEEAEAVLAGLAGQKRPEAQALLDAVRQARLVAEESDFCKQGRDKVLVLMQQRQYAEAFDLVNSLRTLFPDNPMVERDLIAVRYALSQLPGGTPTGGTQSSAPEKSKPRPPIPTVGIPLPAAPSTARPSDHDPSPKPRAPIPIVGFPAPAAAANARPADYDAAPKPRPPMPLVGFDPPDATSGTRPADYDPSPKPRAPMPLVGFAPTDAASGARPPDYDPSPKPRAPMSIVWLPPEPAAAAGEGAPARVGQSSRARRAVIVGAASLVLATAGAAAWKLTRSSAPASQSADTNTVAQSASPVAPALPVQADTAQSSKTTQNSAPPPPARNSVVSTGSEGHARNGDQPVTEAAAPPLRPFVRPPAQQAPAPTSGSGLPMPPGAGPSVTADAVVGLPAVLVKPTNMPERPQPPNAASTPAPKAPLPIGGNMKEAHLVQRVLPEYPPAAFQLGISGVVQLDAAVDEHGNVVSVKVVKGDPALAKAAANAVLKWKYQPATLNGKPIAVSVAVQMAFKKGSN